MKSKKTETEESPIDNFGPTVNQYNDKIDSFALQAMDSILKGIYSNPLMLVELDKIAKEGNKSLADEVAERSYIIAAVVMRVRKKYIINGKESNDNA